MSMFVAHRNSYIKKILNTIDSFYLLQWVNSPTHNLDHTLDLILIYGLSLPDVIVFEYLIS